MTSDILTPYTYPDGVVDYDELIRLTQAVKEDPALVPALRVVRHQVLVNLGDAHLRQFQLRADRYGPQCWLDELGGPNKDGSLSILKTHKAARLRNMLATYDRHIAEEQGTIDVLVEMLHEATCALTPKKKPPEEITT